MKNNPLLKLESFGQSIWLDFISRRILDSGDLLRLINEDGVSGVTSNPSIFEKAIAESNDYDDAIRSLARERKTTAAIYEKLVIEDIQRTADLLHPLYDRMAGRDGFVSLEVSPHLARDGAGTLREARHLWKEVDRPNLLIKVPGTQEGLTVIRQLISEGINVNVTLLFGLPRYQAVAEAEAYISGLEMRVAAGLPLDRISSVASFFLSRIDVLVDPLLEKKLPEGGRPAERASQLRGKIAIASARAAYQLYKEIHTSARFRKLVTGGARPQRVLWASTSTKSPAESDVKYVEALIGPETINTIPLETLNAYRDHGNPALRLEGDLEGTERILQHLPETGIDLDTVTSQLENEGIEKFVKPFDKLLQALEQKRSSAQA
ncbi:transaldolase [Geopsychrobacter electrodiphilus]|uniref:transaldolase n=1 Tax=Geopsychrobacter electrodiphilus TaxID=225196 RepID=UPI00035F3279|nr:transaldolase [Geopsychrobacter electrodiphilus]